jgi:Na+/melibiose symporter-like transporter
MFLLFFCAGIASGCGNTMAPSILSDIIDYDEYNSGERKEGSYFAAYNFAQKTGMGIMILLTGFVLQATGFIPNQEQTMTVQLAMVSLYGLLPFVCYMIGAVLFSRFKLDEKLHTEIRMKLDARHSNGDQHPEMEID